MVSGGSAAEPPDDVDEVAWTFDPRFDGHRNRGWTYSAWRKCRDAGIDFDEAERFDDNGDWYDLDVTADWLVALNAIHAEVPSHEEPSMETLKQWREAGCAAADAYDWGHRGFYPHQVCDDGSYTAADAERFWTDAGFVSAAQREAWSFHRIGFLDAVAYYRQLKDHSPESAADDLVVEQWAVYVRWALDTRQPVDAAAVEAFIVDATANL